uniref:Uncharacterized protein n=1 Tax=Romanomermis culicivorax TaxID=13658 RepID=A0A915K9U3_ROMCU
MLLKILKLIIELKLKKLLKHYQYPDYFTKKASLIIAEISDFDITLKSAGVFQSLEVAMSVKITDAMLRKGLIRSNPGQPLV